jgi:3-deoxy-manno-octulosonate cytidylyltransferase (CMP-KDO synthetase)
MINVEDVKNLNNKVINIKSEIATLACKIKDEKFFENSNIVKVTTDEDLSKDNTSKAKSFSRKVLFNNQENIYHHIGIYMYKISILQKFVNLRQTQNEISQNLEQLRAMENNISIDVILANSSPIGVDTNEDYLEIKKLMEYKS